MTRSTNTVTKTVYGVSAADGKRLWSYEVTVGKLPAQKCDVLFASGLLWVQHWTVRDAKGSRWVGLDPRSGRVIRSFDTPEYIPYSCYPAIATERYAVLNRPNDLLDWQTGSIHEFRAGRNACAASGVIAGGLYATAPNVCACVPGTLRAFAAFGRDDTPDAGSSDRLISGPAALTNSIPPAADAAPAAGDWPTHRHDPRRSASAAIELPSRLETVWELSIESSDPPATLIGDEWRANPLGSDRLTAPVVAEGRVFVALPDRHQVASLDAGDGHVLWKFTCEGRLDVPPTVYAGLCLFGTRSGYVYALRASDGELAWRFRAAPRERNIVVYGQLESRWPVVGGVLVSGGLAYAVCGRSTEIDGGLTVYALDPSTGKTVWSCTPTRDRETGFVGVSDLLVSDGRAVSIGGSNHAMFDVATGRHLPRGEFYALRAAFRNFEKDSWLIAFGPEGDQHGGLIGRDRVFGRFGGTQSFQGQTGRLVAFDGDSGRLVSYYIERLRAAKKSSGRIKSMGRGSPEFMDWVIDLPERVSVGSMAAARNAVVLAVECEDAAGVTTYGLWTLSREKGEIAAKRDLKSEIVPDGLALAAGRIYLSGTDGRVTCLGAK